MGEIILVIGGSGSGKSEFAESLIPLCGKEKKYYIATMKVFGEEGKKKVSAHQSLRKGKGFTTLECEKGIFNTEIEKDSFVLLECMGNLCANWLFEGNKDEKGCYLEIQKEIEYLAERSKKLVIVSNDIFGDGIFYDRETLKYIELMAKVNSFVSDKAHKVIEVVYSIPVYHKGYDIAKV